MLKPFFNDQIQLNLSDTIEHLLGMDTLKSFTKVVKKHMRSPFSSLETTDHPISHNPNVCTYPCSLCTKTFNTYQKYALHMFKTHGIKNSIRLHYGDTFCPICMMQFHSRVRLHNHVQYRSKICRMQLLLMGPVISTEEADSLDAIQRLESASLARKGIRSHKAILYTFRLPGPLPYVIVDRPSSHHTLGFGRNIN